MKAAAPDAKSLNAEAIEAAGKTLLPGLIDVHVHLGATGGFYDDWSKFDPKKSAERELEHYLYCGVTAVRSAGDRLDDDAEVAAAFSAPAKNWDRNCFFVDRSSPRKADTERNSRISCRKHMRAAFQRGICRARRKRRRKRANRWTISPRSKVDAIKGVLEAGVPGYSFNRMDVNILRAVVDEAHAKNLPVAMHTGNATDVADAVSFGADSIEHGSFIDEIPDATIAEMKSKGIAYDPTLSVAEGFTQLRAAIRRC